MHLVIDRLIEVIVGAQGISVPAGNLGSRRPSSGSDIPAVSISLTLETEKSPAIGHFIGSMSLEIWANSFNQADEIARNLQEVLRSSRALLREKGFLKLHPFSLGPAEDFQIGPPLGSAIPVWKQKLEYKFAFEAEDGGELSGGVPIKQVNVEMDDQVVETFSIR